MGPIGDTPYDPLRHYTAVKYDNTSGVLAVSNGIQTEAIYESYKLLYNVKSAPDKSYIKKIMDGANYEPDSLKTPRISGIVTTSLKDAPVGIISIKTADVPAVAWQFKPKAGMLIGVATYHGNMANPGAYDFTGGLTELPLAALTAPDIAGFVYGISAVDYQGDDIRVCAVGGSVGRQYLGDSTD
jgi:IMP cyclohydrolase